VGNVLLGLLEGKDLFVNDGLDLVGLNGTVHLLELGTATDEDTADSADVDEGIEE
jgi:hypothetical protein